MLISNTGLYVKRLQAQFLYDRTNAQLMITEIT